MTSASDDLTLPEFPPLWASLSHVRLAIIRDALDKTGSIPLCAQRLRLHQATVYRAIIAEKSAARLDSVSDYLIQVLALSKSDQASARAIAAAPKPPNESARVDSLLKFFGVDYKIGRGGCFWSLNAGRLDYILHDAHQSWLRMMKAHHPRTADQPSATAASINRCWTRLKELFRNHGVE